MADLIEFPTRAVRGWIEYEQALREVLTQSNANSDMQDELIARMKGVYDQYNIDFRVTADISINLLEDLREQIALAFRNAFGNLEKQIHDFTNHVLFDRLLLEIELYQLKHYQDET